MSSFAPLSEEEKDVLIWKGMALDFVQSAEGLLASVMNMAFHHDGAITIASLETGEAVLRRKTLGQLLAELSKRADLHPQVEDMLDRFLVGRNRFIHNLQAISKDEGEAAALLLIKRVMVDAYNVIRAMTAVLMFWGQQLAKRLDGFSFPPLPAELADIQKLIPEVQYIIRRKQSGD